MSPIVKYANLTLLFLGGFIVSGLFKDATVVTSIPILAMLGAFLGIIVNRTKHLDDLNLTRKKDVSLEFIEEMSEYGSVLVSLIEPNVKPDAYFSNLSKSNKKMNSAMNKFHVVCDDQVSSEIELISFELVSLMQVMTLRAAKLGEDKIALMKWFISDDIFSQLNIIRYKIIRLVNSEIGDGSGTEKFKQAIEKNNIDYKESLSKVLDKLG